MSDTFYTIASLSESIFKEKMSKFLAFAIPVETVDDAKSQIAEYSKKYFDARHVCWAYMIGYERNTYLSSDNGEPSGTAGKPILGQINSFGLTNILIVVVRYFGGIKLGTSGLIAAYRQAARQALEEAEIVEKHQMASLAFHFPYLEMNQVMKLTKSGQVKIDEQQFDNSCYMKISFRQDDKEMLLKKLLDIPGLSLT